MYDSFCLGIPSSRSPGSAIQLHTNTIILMLLMPNPDCCFPFWENYCNTHSELLSIAKKPNKKPLHLALTNLLLTCLLLSNRAQNAGEKSKIFSRFCAQLPSDSGTLGFQGSFLNLEHSGGKNGIKDSGCITNLLVVFLDNDSNCFFLSGGELWEEGKLWQKFCVA